MKARDIMTTNVLSVSPDTSVKEAATLMTERHVSGLPVISADKKIVGIVSQSDLLHRKEIGTEARRKWWLRVFGDPDRMAREYTKAHGLKVQDVMTRHVTSIQEEAELADVAAILDRNKIKRVPVVRDGVVVGIIARSDLVKALSMTPSKTSTATLDNSTLHRNLTDKVRTLPWLETSYLNVVVNDGVVRLWGYVGSNDQRRALRVLVEETEGVKSVEDNLTVGYPTLGAV